MKRYFGLLLLLLLIVPIQAQDGAARRIPDIPYNESDEPRQTLDIYLPANSTAPRPTIFMVHGGGYVFGSKDQMRQTAVYYAEQGYVVVAPTYRLAPEDIYPAPIEDVFCALGWTLAHADDYNIDTDHIILMGESAGANAVSLLATVDDISLFDSDCAFPIAESFEPLTAVLYYMPVGLTTCDCNAAKSMVAIFFGIPTFEIDQIVADDPRFANASPLPFLDETDPPMLLIHGTRDDLVPISESYHFVDAAQEVGIDVVFEPIEGAPHGFFDSFNRRSTQMALRIAVDYLQTFVGDDLAQR
jgi:acetyl esterase/lipase